MIKNYILIAFRNIFKRKLFSIINILGLSLSMSTGLLIILILSDSLQYDNFHDKGDRIYRVLTRPNNNNTPIGTTAIALKNTLLEEYEGIEKVVRFRGGLGGDITYKENTIPLAGYYVDEDLFNVFGFTLESGNPATALKTPYSLVLSKDAARKLFGDEEPLGKIVSINDRGMLTLGIDIDMKDVFLGDFTVTGVVAESKHKSHIKFEMLVSMSTLESLINSGIEHVDMNNWRDVWSTHLYFLANEGKTESELSGILDQISVNKYKSYEDFKVQLILQPLSKITPGMFIGNPMSFRMPIEGFYFLSILALIIILSACFNYTNLTIARSLSRMKEIALRKINGAYRIQIFNQLTIEAIIISLIALVLSVVILQLLKPGFSGLWVNKYFAIGMGENVLAYLFFVIFSILIGVIAGIIPAWLLSAFRPLNMLQNKLSGMVNKKRSFIFKKPMLGNTLTVIQLILSLFFIITSTLLFLQIKHLAKAEFGFSKDNLINIKLRNNDYEIVANEFSAWPAVKRISASSYLPATFISEGGRIYKLDESKDSIDVEHISIDHNFIKNLDLEILAGSDFNPNQIEENKRYIIVNEAAVRKLGFENLHDIIGEKFSTVNEKNAKGNADEIVEVKGVVKDFYFNLLQDQIGALIFTNNPDEYRYLNLKVSGENLNETIAFLEGKWKEIDKKHAFWYRFFDEQLAESQGIFSDILSVVGFVSIIAIVIAGMGLLGMATYNTETRIKEIGIRKVLGANVQGILYHISKGYIYMLIIAILIATPIAYFFNNLWLQNFAIHINLSLWVLGFGILLLLILGLLAIGSQTLKAALSNPANTLRDE